MKKLTQLKDAIEGGKFSGTEILLSGAVLFLLGNVLGLLFSPRKTQMIGCNNGNTDFPRETYEEDYEDAFETENESEE